jgi:DeoR family transcriptional regulator of aga operon/DeoR family fructose operon transcriptional repressor
MLSAERTRRLMDILHQEQSLSVVAAAEQLSVSPSTIRRDLQHLERLGLVARVHGGAVAAVEPATAAREPSRFARHAENAEAKTRIGRAAAGCIRPGETVLIGGGTTTDAMLPFLRTVERLTVVTNNVQTALAVARHPTIPVVVLGGYLRRDEYSLLGHLGVDALAHLTIDRAMFSAYAIDEEGLMGAQVEETETDRTLLRAAHHLVVLVDHTKFMRTGPIRLAPMAEVETLVTDSLTPHHVLDSLAARGVDVITC